MDVKNVDKVRQEALALASIYKDIYECLTPFVSGDYRHQVAMEILRDAQEGLGVGYDTREAPHSG